MTDLTHEYIYEAWETGDKDFETVHNGEWVVDYKYEMKETVLEHKPTGKYYQINETRSGSYFSDYHYEDPEIWEVTPEKKMVEITSWNTVKKVD